METSITLISTYSVLMILIVGWTLDLIFGDPAHLPHPVVYMGKWISFGEHRLNKGRCRKAKGAAFALASILGVYFLVYLMWDKGTNFLEKAASATSISGGTTYLCCALAIILLFSCLVFFCLAGHTLRKEVRMVFEAVDRSLPEGRKQVARIVGRDTNQLSAQEVRTAALETLAENLSDGVIAPLFWFAILGLPGMLAYKMVNTLDSMIGYKTSRYKDFGCWAARIDDVANYVPARITALLILIAGSIRHFSMRRLWTQMAFMKKYASKHASPNSGWPEAALASILDCQFGGTHNYFGTSFYKPHIGSNARLLTSADMRLSLRLCFAAEVLAMHVLMIMLIKA